MPTQHLKLTSADLMEMVNLTGEDHIFEIGDEVGKISESTMLNLIQGEENEALSELPQHYQDILLGKSHGEYLTDPKLGAIANTATLQLAFYPMIEDSLILFLNYDTESTEPFSAVTRDNDAVLDPAEYSVNATTGVITLTTALAAGDKVIASYQHEAGALFDSIRQIVLKLARLELQKRSNNWTEATPGYAEERGELRTKLEGFYNGGNPRGIMEIDRVQFVNETRANKGETLYMPFLGGRW